MKTNVSVDLFQVLTSAVYFPQSGSCEVITEEAAAALRKANKWAQSGLIVSVGPPVETLVQEAAGGITTGDKKKTAQTAVCRDRNADLARCENKNKHRIVITRFVHWYISFYNVFLFQTVIDLFWLLNLPWTGRTLSGRSSVAMLPTVWLLRLSLCYTACSLPQSPTPLRSGPAPLKK